MKEYILVRIFIEEEDRSNQRMLGCSHVNNLIEDGWVVDKIETVPQHVSSGGNSFTYAMRGGTYTFYYMSRIKEND